MDNVQVCHFNILLLSCMAEASTTLRSSVHFYSTECLSDMYLQGHTKATIHGGSVLEATVSITACVSRVSISRTAVGKSVQQNEIFPLPVRHSDLETVFLKQ
jgi:hypothetical protein